MANIGKWNTPRGIATLLNTELQNLASGAMSAWSAAYDNTGNLDMYHILEFTTSTTFSAVAPNRLDIYMAISADGSNYPPSNSGSPVAADIRLIGNLFLCSIFVGTTAAVAWRSSSDRLILPPFKLKFAADNQLGVGLPNDANAFLKTNPYNTNLNG